MKTAIATVALLAVAACGNTATNQATPAECDAVRQIVDIAAQAYEAKNGEPAPDIDAIAADELVDENTPLDWYLVNQGAVTVNPDGHCA